MRADLIQGRQGLWGSQGLVGARLGMWDGSAQSRPGQVEGLGTTGAFQEQQQPVGRGSGNKHLQ